MNLLPAGSRVDYRVTFLEMRARPAYPWPPQPVGLHGALLRADAPPLRYFHALYDAVGRDYAWEDLNAAPADETAAWLADADVALYTLMPSGWPHAFFVLDGRTAGTCDLAYFRLVPDAVGRGFGTWLLRTAVLTAWDRPGVTRLTVNTCSLDHPRALALYQRNGFEVVAQEVRSRVLVRDRDPACIPD